MYVQLTINCIQLLVFILILFWRLKKIMEKTQIPQNHPLCEMLQKISHEDADLLLAFFFLNYSGLERCSNGLIKRVKWIAEKERLQSILCEMIPRYAGKVAPSEFKLNDVYTEIVKRIEKKQGFAVEEEKEEIKNTSEEIMIASLYQQPQPLLDELVEKVWCEYSPGQGDIYESYESKEGMRVRAVKLPGEIIIQLNAEKMGKLNINFKKYKLMFAFKSDQIDKIMIKLQEPMGGTNRQRRTIIQEEREGLQKMRWTDVELNIPKEFSQIVIEPRDEGIFYINKMRFHLK